ncbi:MAG: hypothetical protein ABSG68_01810 [Thermoguttaceae bacterium]|jgi:hypothetical protein
MKRLALATVLAMTLALAGCCCQSPCGYQQPYAAGCQPAPAACYQPCTPVCMQPAYGAAVRPVLPR